MRSLREKLAGKKDGGNAQDTREAI
jgi:hypothetical protein